jgi:hypothetical protein
VPKPTLATKNPGTEKKPRGVRVVPFQTTAWLPLPVPFAPAAVPKLLMLLANPGPRLVGVVPFQMTALVPLAPVSEPATCPALLIARASLEDKGATATLRAEIANEGTGGSVAVPTLARSSQTLTAPAPYWRNHPGLNQSCADALCLELLATLSPGQ